VVRVFCPDVLDDNSLATTCVVTFADVDVVSFRDALWLHTAELHMVGHVHL
jgi:hypothetical protein